MREGLGPDRRKGVRGQQRHQSSPLDWGAPWRAPQSELPILPHPLGGAMYPRNFIFLLYCPQDNQPPGSEMLITERPKGLPL